MQIIPLIRCCRKKKHRKNIFFLNLGNRPNILKNAEWSTNYPSGLHQVYITDNLFTHKPLFSKEKNSIFLL